MSAKNTKLMDTEPGGEQTQYEGAATSVQATKKSTGQFGRKSETTQVAEPGRTAAEKKASGEKIAENIRYGEAISESGFGGKTEGFSGDAGQEGGYGGAEAQGDDLKQSRREQGYGSGNDVGA